VKVTASVIPLVRARVKLAIELEKSPSHTLPLTLNPLSRIIFFIFILGTINDITVSAAVSNPPRNTASTRSSGLHLYTPSKFL